MKHVATLNLAYDQTWKWSEDMDQMKIWDSINGFKNFIPTTIFF
jgi:hypothetical protein